MILKTTSGYKERTKVSGTDATLVGSSTAANLSTTGMTVLSGVSGVDDGNGLLPVSFPFYFFGTDYGSNLNKVFWCTNSVIHFNTGNSTIGWTATTGRGILLGNADRRTNTIYYSSAQTSGSFQYINLVLYGQNIYSDGVANAIKWQMRMVRGTSFQYIELRANTAPSTAGTWNITNGTTFQNTFTGFTNVIAGSSFVLRSDLQGNNWTLFNNNSLPF